MLVGYAFEGVYDHGCRDEISTFAVPAFPGAFLVSKHGPAGRAQELGIIISPEFRVFAHLAPPINAATVGNWPISVCGRKRADMYSSMKFLETDNSI